MRDETTAIASTRLIGISRDVLLELARFYRAGAPVEKVRPLGRPFKLAAHRSRAGRGLSALEPLECGSR
jgi:hypothetical protein